MSTLDPWRPTLATAAIFLMTMATYLGFPARRVAGVMSCAPWFRQEHGVPLPLLRLGAWPLPAPNVQVVCFQKDVVRSVTNAKETFFKRATRPHDL